MIFGFEENKPNSFPIANSKLTNVWMVAWLGLMYTMDKYCTLLPI